MPLDFRSYVPLCISTEAPASKSVWPDKGIEFVLASVRITHGILGLISELQELQEWLNTSHLPRNLKGNTNAIEELGDLYWYTGLLFDAYSTVDPEGTAELANQIAELEASWETISAGAPYTFSTLGILVDCVGQLANTQKRYLHYGAKYPVSDKCSGIVLLSAPLLQLRGICTQLAYLCKELSLKPDDVRRANIRKLHRRYPERFDTNQALDRNLLAEQIALEENQ